MDRSSRLEYVRLKILFGPYVALDIFNQWVVLLLWNTKDFKSCVDHVRLYIIQNNGSFFSFGTCKALYIFKLVSIPYKEVLDDFDSPAGIAVSVPRIEVLVRLLVV